MIDRLIHSKSLTEAHVVRVIRCITSAIAYLHERNIVHRDIKPDNILYFTKAEDSEVVLVDFGVAQALNTRGELMSSLAGSFAYAAPEVLGDSRYGAEVDIWSIGVVAYVLIAGYTPFKGNTPKELRMDQLQHAAGFDEKYWGKVSPQARDFIRYCLTIDYNKRLTAEEALEHPWLTEAHDDTTNLIAGLRENYGRDKLQRPPMPRRNTRLIYVQRRGLDRHELESSDEESSDEGDGQAQASAGTQRAGIATGAGVGGTAAGAGGTATASKGKGAGLTPLQEADEQANASPRVPASIAASSARPSTSISRAETPVHSSGRPSLSEPRSGRPSASASHPKVPTSEASGSGTGSDAPSKSSGGVLSGLASLVRSDSGSSKPRSKSKSRFSFLRMSRSGSRAGSDAGGVKSSAELEESAFDDDEEGEAAPMRSK